MKNKSLLDSKIHCGDDFFFIVDEVLNGNKSKIVSFVNPFSYFSLVNKLNIITDIDYFFSDGSLHSILHSYFCQKINRASFDYSSIAEEFFNLAINKNLRVAMIGATENELNNAKNSILNKFPKLNICYARNGYFTDIEYNSIVDDLNFNSPDIVIIGMGTPYQEEMALKLKYEMKNKLLIITCGGFFTQTSIRDDYYFPIVKALGLRWLQRMVMHKHVRERVFKIYPKFVLHYIKDSLKNV